jgi:hypothetical protein
MAAKGSEYTHNHYVPEWYQKRFLPSGLNKFWYLDLAPATISRNGHNWVRRNLLNWGPSRCFAQNDLYTISYGGIKITDIEQFFFGRVDAEGKFAVEHFSNFKLNSDSHKAFQSLLPYLTVQKLRTPKGLGYLMELSQTQNKALTLLLLQRIQNMYCAIWTECVWQIADAEKSPTKFIVSDHPVTVYNRDCFPGSKFCLGFNDPDIRFVATHTLFPLSLNKVLILTNLSWVRDPYQNALNVRPNSDFFRDSFFNFTDIQFDRFLAEEEVIEINYIIKNRAFRYIAAAEKEWLYPERSLRCDHWRKLGDGYLLMPDPRHVHGGGQVVFGYSDGRSDGFSEYGHKPWQKGFEDEERSKREWRSLQRFKAEWSAKFGPSYRGLCQHWSPGKTPRVEEDEELHRKYVERDRAVRREAGERQRRRSLQRLR